MRGWHVGPGRLGGKGTRLDVEVQGSQSVLYRSLS